MTALDKDALYAACRAIYEWAGTDFILPPLTRGAAAGSPAERKLEAALFAGCTLSFAVSLDPHFADRNTRPHAQLPVLFDISVRGTDGSPSELTSEQQHELTGAFLLGAKLPMAMEESAEGLQRLLLQLASTYNFDCGDVSGLGDASECETICSRVSETLQSLSAPFFASLESGRAVWQIRARQELFGDPRPPAVVFWPYPELPQAKAYPFFRNQPVRRQRSFAVPSALAASFLLAMLATATLIGATVLRDVREEPVATVTPVRLTVAMPEAERAPSLEAPLAEVVPAKTDQRDAEFKPAVLVTQARTEPKTAVELPAPAPALPALVAMASLPALAAIAPADTQRPTAQAPARTKTISKSKKPVRITAKVESKNQFVNPLPGARKAVTTLVHGIERLPTRLAALVKQHTAN